jgi:hypothetical protein
MPHMKWLEFFLLVKEEMSLKEMVQTQILSAPRQVK